MFKSSKLIGTAFVFIMLLSVSNEISARVCALKSSSGTCLFWSGSVGGELTASRVDVSKEHQLGMIITPQKGTSSPSSPPRALLLCDDPINLVLPPTAPPILQSVELSSSVINAFSQFKNLSELDKINPYPTGQFDIKQTFITSPLDITQSQYAQNYDALKQQCPGDSKPIDFVSCKMNVIVQLKQKRGATYKLLSQEKFSCTLPGCQSLGYDPVTKKYDRRDYQCIVKNDDDDDEED